MRIKRVIEWVEKSPLDAVLIDNPVDLLYLTGLSVSIGKLAVTGKEATLFLDGRYVERAKKEAPCEVGLSSKESLTHVLKGFKKVGFDSAYLSVDAFENLRKDLPDKEWTPQPKPIKQFRAVKDAGEIEALKRAARLTWAGYKEILSHVTEGVSEEELALVFEFYCRKNGGGGLSFESNISFGDHSAYPHYRAGKRRLKQNEIILMDIGSIVDGYRGDMTRVFFFGKVDPRLVEMGKQVEEAKAAVIEAIRPGIRFGELDKIARSFVQFDHGLSHGIGLELHEYPTLRVQGGDSDVILQPGMVFSVEPGLYVPGLGGYRAEDTLLVTQNGSENFYAQL